MKIVKRIIFTILGLLLISSVSLVGVILYAEYSGQHFWEDSENETADADGESRLAYDENGNIAELPGASLPQSEQTGYETQGNPENSSIPDTAAPDFSGTDMSDISTAGTDVSAPASYTDNNNTEDTAAETSLDEAAAAGGDEQLYIMDMDSGLFHTGNCTDVPDISQDSRSERTTARDKILDAGYEPCPHCNP